MHEYHSNGRALTLYFHYSLVLYIDSYGDPEVLVLTLTLALLNPNPKTGHQRRCHLLIGLLVVGEASQVY